MSAYHGSQQTLARLARFDASTDAALARLDAEASHLEELANRLSDDDTTPCRPTSDEQAGMVWFNALTERARSEWLAHAGSGRPIDAWRAFKRCYPDVSPHAAFLSTNLLRAPTPAGART